MKRLFTMVLAFSACICVFAQNNFRDRHMAYKGFSDIGLGSAFSDGDNSTSFTLTTSHGIQINPYFFAGAGIGVDLSSSSNIDGATVIAPIFGQVRANILNKNISPYVDLKGGGTVGDFKGGYLEPSFGVSMPVTTKFAIDFSLVYTLYTHKEEYDLGWFGYETERIAVHSIGFKFGFEF